MKDLGITKGEFEVEEYNNKYYITTTKRSEDNWDVCHTITSYETDKANAQLIADAFNTANKTNMLPSELLEQRDELLKAINTVLSLRPLIEYPSNTKEEHREEAIAISNMLSKCESILKQITNEQ